MRTSRHIRGADVSSSSLLPFEAPLLQRRAATAVARRWPERREGEPLASGHALFLIAAVLRGPVFSLISHNNNPICVGKYLVSPLSRRLEDGLYAASVSIRAGRGSASTDRVMRFKGSFDSEAAAHQYARDQGLIWIAETQPEGSSPWPKKN